MNEDVRKKFLEHLRQVSVESIMRSASRNGPAHFNCRSRIEPLPPKVIAFSNPSNERPFYAQACKMNFGSAPEEHANTVVSWESLAAVIGADTVRRVREV